MLRKFVPVARTVVRAVRQSSNSRPPRSGSDPWEGTPIESICKVMEREFQHIERGEFGHILNWKSFISRVAPSAKELFSYVQPIVEEEDGKKKFKCSMFDFIRCFAIFVNFLYLYAVAFAWYNKLIFLDRRKFK